MRFLFPKLKSPSDDHFENQMIGAARHADAHAKVEFPFRRNVQIDSRNDLMLLFAFGIEAAEWAKRAIVFKYDVDFLSHRVSDFEVGCELEDLIPPGHS